MHNLPHIDVWPSTATPAGNMEGGFFRVLSAIYIASSAAARYSFYDIRPDMPAAYAMVECIRNIEPFLRIVETNPIRSLQTCIFSTAAVTPEARAAAAAYGCDFYRRRTVPHA